MTGGEADFPILNAIAESLEHIAQLLGEARSNDRLTGELRQINQELKDISAELSGIRQELARHR